MQSDSAIARIAFARSATGAEAQLRTATLRLEIESARRAATVLAAASGIAAPDVAISIEPGHVDKRA